MRAPGWYWVAAILVASCSPSAHESPAQDVAPPVDECAGLVQTDLGKTVTARPPGAACGSFSTSDGIGNFALGAIDLAGNALILFWRQDLSLAGRWFDRAGNPRTDWFRVPASSFRALTSLPEGGVAAYDPKAGRFMFAVRDLETTASPLPGWLEARARNSFYVVREGRAIASRGKDGPCEDRLEILARSGKSCGCLSVPDFSTATTIGRDGSLIVPRTDGSRQCTYTLYPQLLK